MYELRRRLLQGPITMALTPEEYQMMVDAGTKFKTIAEPVDYDRDDVVYPAGWLWSLFDVGEMRLLEKYSRC